MPPQPTLKHTAGLNSLLTAWAAIRGLHHLLWTAHWVSEGDPQYGDHLLYQRLYEARVMEIDGIAEQLVLMGGPAAVNPAQYSLGVVNLLSGIAQSLNEAIYLLGRRVKI